MLSWLDVNFVADRPGGNNNTLLIFIDKKRKLESALVAEFQRSHFVRMFDALGNQLLAQNCTEKKSHYAYQNDTLTLLCQPSFRTNELIGSDFHTKDPATVSLPRVL
jgi:hypothetical protein